MQALNSSLLFGPSYRVLLVTLAVDSSPYRWAFEWVTLHGQGSDMFSFRFVTLCPVTTRPAGMCRFLELGSLVETWLLDRLGCRSLVG